MDNTKKWNTQTAKAVNYLVSRIRKGFPVRYNPTTQRIYDDEGYIVDWGYTVICDPKTAQHIHKKYPNALMDFDIIEAYA